MDTFRYLHTYSKFLYGSTSSRRNALFRPFRHSLGRRFAIFPAKILLLNPTQQLISRFNFLPILKKSTTYSSKNIILKVIILLSNKFKLSMSRPRKIWSHSKNCFLKSKNFPTAITQKLEWNYPSNKNAKIKYNTSKNCLKCCCVFLRKCSKSSRPKNNKCWKKFRNK